MGGPAKLGGGSFVDKLIGEALKVEQYRTQRDFLRAARDQKTFFGQVETDHQVNAPAPVAGDYVQTERVPEWVPVAAIAGLLLMVVK